MSLRVDLTSNLGLVEALVEALVGALSGLRLGVCLGVPSEAEKVRTSAAESLFFGTCMTKNGKRVSKVAVFSAMEFNGKPSRKQCFRNETSL